MRLVLVDNLMMADEGSLATLDVHPHLGLLALSAAAESDGHEVRILDPKRLIRSGHLAYEADLYDRVASMILRQSPHVVGFTALGCSFLFAANVAAALKRREPDLPIMLGGPHATMLHKEILQRFPVFDVIARYEADQTIPMLLAKLESRAFDTIPGVSWRAGSMSDRLHFSQGLPLVENLDSLPIASYDHYPVADLGLDLLRIEAGRGCPFACTFCSTAGFFQRKFRLKSADRLVIELDLLNQQYGYSDFKLDHDLFTVNRHKVMEFCEAVKDRGYRWRASARVDCVNEELLTKMAEAGCVGLYFGIETGSKRMQQISRKRLHLDLVLPTLDIAEHLGIDTTASFITGYPEELERDQDETLDLIGHCHRPSCLSQLHILTPEPGTPMYEKYGDQLAYDGHSGPYNAFPLSEEDECLLFEQKDIFQTYHYYPSQIPRHQHLFAVNAVDMLRRVGPIILRYALRAYDGRLSGLVRDLQRYIEDYYPKRPLASHIIESYLVSKFGPRHHLVSLFRYAHIQHHAQQASEGCEAGTMPNRFDPNLAYQLGPSVHILHDLHDCGALIERITHQSRNDDLLDEGEVGERGIYLLNTVGGNSMHCCIEEEVEAILELFRSPLSFAAIAESIGETGEDGPFKDFFEQLVQSGVLVPYGAGASGVGQPRRVFGFESTCV